MAVGKTKLQIEVDNAPGFAVLHLLDKIEAVSRDLKPYFNTVLKRMANINTSNAKIICDYIIAEQNEINIKESTREGKIKVLIWLAEYLKNKTFREITKPDIMQYLNSLKKTDHEDPLHKCIGTYNSRQMILLKFFRWLYNPDEPDHKRRIIPACMSGVKRLPRQEKSPYKPGDLWTDEEHAVFLKYCPSKRDRAYHAMASDTSARPREILSLKIKDISFKLAEESVQYAEVLVSGKTKSRTLPLIFSVPYVKDWLRDHPFSNSPEAWLFISLSKKNSTAKLTHDALLKHYKEQFRDRHFPRLLKNNKIPESDKAFMRSILTKPWSLYVFRHGALIQKSRILKEHVLRDHAGWSMTSKMPQVYLHYFGTESSTSLLEAYGVVKRNDKKQFSLKIKQCPNCNESNKVDSKFCAKCGMVLTYDAYNETLDKQQEKESEISKLRKDLEPLLALKKTLEDQGLLKVT